jgi:hypothetical protein
MRSISFGPGLDTMGEECAGAGIAARPVANAKGIADSCSLKGPPEGKFPIFRLNRG